MKIARRFIWGESDLGEGWIPMWIPRDAGFDPSEKRGIVHDMLEHGHNDRGTFADEVRAFGRIHAMRNESGVSFHRSFRDPVEAQGEELYDIWQRANHPSFNAPATGPMDVDEHIGADVRKMVAAFAKAWSKDRDGDEFNYVGGRDELHKAQCCTAIANLLKIGYADAMRRYGGSSGCTRVGWACYSFVEDKQIRLPEGEEDDILTVSFDTDEQRFQMRQTTYNEEGVMPQWARKRRAAWYRS